MTGPNKDIILVLIISSLFGLLSLWIFGFMQFQTDSPGYLNAIDMLCGNPSEADRLQRLSKPLSLIFPATVCKLFGIGSSSALLLQQFISYLAASLLLFLIIDKIKNKTQAYIGLLILLTSQCFAIYGLSLMVDGIAWAAELFAIYFYLQIKDKGLKGKYLLLGLVLGIFFFVKETVLMSGFFIAADLFIGKSDMRTKVLNYLQIGIVFLFCAVLGSLMTEHFFGSSLLSWWKFANSDNEVYALNLKSYLQQLYRSLDLFWIPTMIGLLAAFDEFRKATLSKAEIAFLLCGIFGILIFPYLWSYRTDRILFMIALFFIPFAAKGLKQFGNWAFPLTLIAGISNIFMTYRIYRFEESGWISLFFIFYTVIMLLTVIVFKFKVFQQQGPKKHSES